MHFRDRVIEPRPTSDGIAFGFQHVSGNRKNSRSGRQTVTSFAVLHDVATGHSLQMTEMIILTALRTAAISGLGDEVMQAVIGIGGNHRRTQWKPHPPGEEASIEVSETPCWNDNMQRPIRATERRGNRRIEAPRAVRFIVARADPLSRLG